MHVPNLHKSVARLVDDAIEESYAQAPEMMGRAASGECARAKEDHWTGAVFLSAEGVANYYRDFLSRLVAAAGPCTLALHPNVLFNYVSIDGRWTCNTPYELDGGLRIRSPEYLEKYRVDCPLQTEQWNRLLRMKERYPTLLTLQAAAPAIGKGDPMFEVMNVLEEGKFVWMRPDEHSGCAATSSPDHEDTFKVVTDALNGPSTGGDVGPSPTLTSTILEDTSSLRFFY